MTANNTYHEKLMFIDLDCTYTSQPSFFFSLFETKKSSSLYLTSPHFIKFLEIKTPHSNILFDIPPIHSRRNNRYFNSICLSTPIIIDISFLFHILLLFFSSKVLDLFPTFRVFFFFVHNGLI